MNFQVPRKPLLKYIKLGAHALTLVVRGKNATLPVILLASYLLFQVVLGSELCRQHQMENQSATAQWTVSNSRVENGLFRKPCALFINSKYNTYINIQKETAYQKGELFHYNLCKTESTTLQVAGDGAFFSYVTEDVADLRLLSGAL